MKALHVSQQVWEVVENGHKEPTDMEEQTIPQLATMRASQVKDKIVMYVLY